MYGLSLYSITITYCPNSCSANNKKFIYIYYKQNVPLNTDSNNKFGVILIVENIIRVMFWIRVAKVFNNRCRERLRVVDFWAILSSILIRQLLDRI